MGGDAWAIYHDLQKAHGQVILSPPLPLATCLARLLPSHSKTQETARRSIPPTTTLFLPRSIFAAPVGDEPINVGYEGGLPDLPPSKVWRSVEAIADGDFCTTTDASCSTAWELLVKAAETFPQRKAQGSRPFIGPKFVEEGDKFPAKHLGPAEWRTCAWLPPSLSIVIPLFIFPSLCLSLPAASCGCPL